MQRWAMSQKHTCVHYPIVCGYLDITDTGMVPYYVSHIGFGLGQSYEVQNNMTDIQANHLAIHEFIAMRGLVRLMR